jgi:hypothetical protein
MEKRELKNGNGYVQYDDPKELKKLFLLDDETKILGLAHDEWAEVDFLTPEFQEIAQSIENFYLNCDDRHFATFALNDDYSINLEVLPVAKGDNSKIAMSLTDNDGKVVYMLVEYIDKREADTIANPHEFMLDFLGQWILNISIDITHQSLFWLYEGQEEFIQESLANV